MTTDSGTGGGPSRGAAPGAVDMLFEVVDAADPNAPGAAIDSRLRLGAARRDIGPTRTEAQLVQHVLEAIPAEQRPTFSGDHTVLPAPDDARADVKRSLRHDGPTGFGLVTNGQLLKYLGKDEVSRILDGSFRIYAVDQAGGPVLSYLRVGKAEPKLGTDANGAPVEGSGTELPKTKDRSKDTKYASGIGLYTEGQIQAYSKGTTNMRSSAPFCITAPSIILTSYGERWIASYDIGDADIERVNAGDIDDTQVDRTIVNLDWRHKQPDGWYTQMYDRGKRLDFSTSHKGEVSTSLKYSLALGLAFNHTYSAGLETGYAATVEVKGSSGVKVVTGGFDSEFFGKKGSIFESVDLTGNGSVKITCGDLIGATMMKTMEGFSIATRVAVAAQSSAFLAYEAALAAKANMTVDRSQDPNTELAVHGFQDAFKAGPAIYDAAIGTSALITAAGLLLAAVQAAKSVLPDPLGAPKLEMTPFTIKLSCGPMSSIAMSPLGILIKGIDVKLQAVSAATGAPRATFSP